MTRMQMLENQMRYLGYEIYGEFTIQNLTYGAIKKKPACMFEIYSPLAQMYTTVTAVSLLKGEKIKADTGRYAVTVEGEGLWLIGQPQLKEFRLFEGTVMGLMGLYTYSLLSKGWNEYPTDYNWYLGMFDAGDDKFHKEFAKEKWLD